MAYPFDVDPNEGRPLNSGVPPGRIRIWRAGQGMTTDPLRVYAMLGTERPRVIRGYGGWTSLQRDGRRAVSTFNGADTPAYSIGVRLSNDRPISRPVAETMRALERLCGWERADDTPPPVLNWIANVMHDDAAAPQNEWVCESLEWGDSLSTDRGTLLWQDATIVLGLYVAPALPKLTSTAGFVRRELRKGQTLMAFARQHLGDAKRWKDVAALNRDNAGCPKTPQAGAARTVMLLVPPREPKAKGAKRGR